MIRHSPPAADKRLGRFAIRHPSSLSRQGLPRLATEMRRSLTRGPSGRHPLWMSCTSQMLRAGLWDAQRPQGLGRQRDLRHPRAAGQPDWTAELLRPKTMFCNDDSNQIGACIVYVPIVPLLQGVQ